MKRLFTIFTATILIFLISTTSFAGTWQQVGTNWKYLKDDGAFAKSEWVLDNSKWYRFDDQEIMLANQWVEGLYYLGADGAMFVSAFTPDGYWVGADGKWDSSVSQTTNNSNTAATNSTYYSGSSNVTRSSFSSGSNSATETRDFVGNYIGNLNSKKFHRISCSSVEKMAEHNKVQLDSREEAISNGYVPCKICNP